MNIDELIAMRDNEELNIRNYVTKCQRRIDKLDEQINKLRLDGHKTKEEIHLELEKSPKFVTRKEPSN